MKKDYGCATLKSERKINVLNAFFTFVKVLSLVKKLKYAVHTALYAASHVSINFLNDF